MKETMHDCYRSQFRCMQHILEARKELLNDFVSFCLKQKPDRIYLLGSGTSFTASSTAAPYMERLLQTEVTSIVPSSSGVLYGERPLVIASSQSGRSTNTLHAIREIKKKDAVVVTLTDPVETPVGSAGDIKVHLAAENETVGPRTRGYSATVLTLQLMALEYAYKAGTISEREYSQELKKFQQVLDQGENFYMACQTFYEEHLENLKKAKKYIFAGKGTCSKVALEDALKVLETLCYPAIGYEYEEFLHGPACCADEELALFLFLSNDTDRDRILQTADIMDRVTPNCYVISGDAGIRRHNTLVLSAGDDRELSVFAAMLFGQLLSARLTLELNRRRHPQVKNIFSDMGTKCAVAENS